MAAIYNSDLSKELIDGAKIQISKDAIPTQLAEKVVPVMEVNPKLLRRVNIVKRNGRTSNGTSTIYTVPTGKKFYLTGIWISYEKNAACDGAVTPVITFTMPSGESQTFRQANLTLSASIQSNYIDLAHTPVEFLEGTAITHALTFTAGAASSEITILGYLTDNPNA